MSASNDPTEKFQRFMDLNDEPLTDMAPIRGYNKMPLVSLEEAVQPLIPNIAEIEHMVDIAKKKSIKPPPDHLTEDQSAAIMLYTLEWEPKEESVYYRLNQALRTEDRQALKPWFLYLKLLFTALAIIPSNSRTVYRGVKADLKHRYKKGENVIWWGFSSCTSTMDVLQNESFMGAKGKRTMFSIECQSAKEIKEHSYFRGENEVLLPAARAFQVESILPQGEDLCIIQLKEVQPKYPLLDTPTLNKIVQESPLFQSNSTTKIAFNQVNPQQTQPSLNQSQSNEQDYSRTTIDANQRPKHRRRWYLAVGCGLVFCCPCTAGYLCIKQ